MSELRIASNCDSQEEMRAALESRRTLKGPIGMNVELARHRTAPPDNRVVVLTEVNHNDPGPDGSIEHGPLTVSTYVNGELVETHPTQPPLPPHDSAAYSRRYAEAGEIVADQDAILSQDNLMVPNSDAGRMAYQNAQSLSEADLAPHMTLSAYRKYRARK
jgi:hypothetical protein